MPNHVTTRCIVTGPQDQIDAFVSLMFREAVEGKETVTLFDFDRIIPQPDLIKDSEESSNIEEAMYLIIMRGEDAPPFATMGMYDTQIQRIRADVGMPGSRIGDVADVYLRKHPGLEAKARRRLQAILETGCATWYQWNRRHWGTKWNSYSVGRLKADPLEFTFETAWSFPVPVFEKLAATFPALKFQCWTYDEGDNFAGEGCFNGDGSDKPFALCDASDDLYEAVYGEARPKYEDEDAA